jgi:hypothetical protein
MTLRGRQSGVDLKPPQAAVDKSDSGERCESPPGDSTKATSEEGPFLADFVEKRLVEAERYH